MKTNDLRVGDILTYRNGDKEIIPSQGYLETIIEHCDYNLKTKNRRCQNADIMKVQRYIKHIGYYSYKDGVVVGFNSTFYTLATMYERKEEILDEGEKRYLRNVIRPIRNNVINIAKHNCLGKEYICIELDDGELEFPSFPKGTMYKGMELYKEYTLKELGL